jgi:hypothetical protein
MFIRSTESWLDLQVWPPAPFRLSLRWNSQFAQGNDDCCFILLPNPLKPAGRDLNVEEVGFLREWLAGSPARRLLLDTVYTFDREFADSSAKLFDTGQTILLHSLSKGWLRPHVFGIALVPEIEISLLSPIFRANSPSAANLFLAQELIIRNSELPGAVRRELARRGGNTSVHLKRIQGVDLSNDSMSDGSGYLMPIPISCEELVEKHNMLAIPASVFGSRCEGWSVVSSLAQCQ